MNTVAIIELSGQLEEFIDFLKKNGFYTSWTVAGTSKIFDLPSCCVWRKSELSAPDEATNESHDLIIKCFSEYCENFAERPEILKLLVLPAKPYASIEKETPYETFCKKALAKNPKLDPDTLLDLYELARTD